LFGFWGGLLIILTILAIAIILLFNITLSHLIGSRSFVYKIFNYFSNNHSEENYEHEEDIEEDQSEDEDEEEGELENEDDDILFSKKEIGKNNDFKENFDNNDLNSFKKEKKEEKVNWKTKKIKIDLPLDLLSGKINKATSGDINNNILIIQRTLENFGISVEMGEVNVGPTVTQYTFKPSEGIKVSRITALSNDLSLALAAHPIRIEAPIPGKALVGIEVPNRSKAIVGLREVLEDNDFKTRPSNLTAALGKDVSGKNIVYDIAKMPHLLVAGATNSGKSVCLNTIIISLLYQNNPDDLRFIMVDPKRVELPAYNGIPHLLTPVITEVSKTINALRWCLNEMDRRYEILNQAGKKNIQTYNKSSKEKMPYIIFVIDELADLMVAAAKDIEGSVIRLTQMSRAVGIHLILATQRPSVDVITGLIKANTPARIAFSVASAVDSKTIIDSSGAEKLLGKGDMLFSTAELSKPKRIQGAYVDDSEILSITNYIKDKYGSADYLEGIVERQKVSGIGGVGLDGSMGDEDELLEEAKEIIIAAGKASTSFLQRRLRIGYSRAASILDMLEETGIVGPSNGSKPRELLISKEQYENQLNNPMAGIPVHDRKESKVPDNYLYQEDESPLVLESEDEEVEEIVSEEETENNLEEDNDDSINNEDIDLDDDFGKYSSK
ncbi:MAG: DNA translocase FtsK, partial [Candidatus Caldatribacteriota bacterium]